MKEFSPEDMKLIAHELQAGQNCAVRDQLKDVPYEEQIRILKAAVKVGNAEASKATLDLYIQVSPADSHLFTGRKDTELFGWLGVPSGYDVRQSFYTGKTVQHCEE